MKRQTKALIKRMVSWLEVVSIELAIVLVAFIAAVVTVIFFTKLIFVDKKDHFDLAVFEMIRPMISSRTTSLVNFFTFFGGQFFLIPANLLLIAYMFFIEKNKWFALQVLSVSISSLLLMFFLKYLFQRPRPISPLLTEVRGMSFPSGHAFMSFAFFGLLIYIIYEEVKNKWLKLSLILFFILMTLAIGFSRIYLRVHYASDVIVGFATSLVWLVVAVSILHRVENYKTKLPPVQ